LGEVVVGIEVAVFGGEVTVISPVTQPVGILVKDVLNALDAGMTGRMVDGIQDGLLDLLGEYVESPVAERNGSQPHGLGQERHEGVHEASHSPIIRGLLLQVLYPWQQLGIAVLDVPRAFVVAVAAIHHQNARGADLEAPATTWTPFPSKTRRTSP